MRGYKSRCGRAAKPAPWKATVWRKAGAALLAAALAIGPARLAIADVSDPDVARLTAAGHSLEWNWTPPGHAERYGHAETLVHAPLPAVRTHVLDFAHYKGILPDKFRQSRIVGHGPDHSTDVYIQIAVLHGVISLWNVSRFTGPRETAPGVEVVEGRMIPGKGNVDDMHVQWTLRSIADDWTVVKLDMLLKPGLPVPQSAIDEELRDSSRYAVDAIHDRAQGSKEFIAYRASN